MIPVALQPEPENFIQRVKNPGMQFLTEIPQPSSQQWRGKAYWQRALPDMRTAYGGVCAYSAYWIPHGTGRHSIDHFYPKSEQPNLAYEWDNFRYVSARFNSRKGTKIILDPFEILSGWFVINFTSFLIHPSLDLPANQQKMIGETIECLKLNEDDDLVLERQTWFMDYVAGHISFEHLQKMAPFLAYEILRQEIDLASSGIQY